MKALKALIIKESRHIVRDTRSMVITILIPIMLLLLFGFAISTEVNNVRVGAVVEHHSEYSRSLIERLAHNEYFTFTGMIAAADIDATLRSGRAEAVLFIRDDRAQVIVDASNTVTARAVTGYIQSIVADSPTPLPVITSTLYNPQLKSAYNFVPGILGMIFILICAIMTSVSIVREKESGTMNLLLVSPIAPRTIILGKLVPYFVISCAILGMMLLISYTLLGLPFSATVLDVVLISVVYIIMALSIGLLVSTLVDTQLTALIVSAVLFMLPVIMLSGMIFPIENMPAPLQWLSCIIPARWYVDAMRKLMIQQLDIAAVANDLLIIAAIAAVVLTVAVKKFKTKA